MTPDTTKTRSELIEELQELRQRVAQLEAAETARDTYELQETDHLLSTIFNNTTDLQMVFGAEPDGEFRLRAVNQAYLDAANRFGLNITREHYVGLALEEVVLKVLGIERQLLDDTLAKYRLVAASGKPMEYTESIVVMDQPYHSRVRLSPILDSQDNCRYVLYTSHDITEQKRIEEERSFQANLLNTVGQAVIATDPDGTISYLNRAAETLYGWPAAEALGRNVMTVTVPDVSQEQARSIMEHVRRGEAWSGEFLAHRRDGTSFPAMVSDEPVLDASGHLVGIVGLSSDITERKQTEEVLRKNEAFLRTIYQNSDMSVFVVNVTETGGYVYEGINPVHERLTGVKNQEIAGKTPDDLIPFLGQETVHYIYALYDECVQKGDTIESEFYVPEGDAQGWWFSRLTPVRDENGRIYKLVGSGIVITALKEAQQALRTSEERFELAMQATNDGLYDWNLATNDIYYSPAWKRMLGYADDELEDEFSVWERLTDPEDVKASWKMLHELLDGKRDRFDMEFKMRHKDGHWVDILSRANAVFDDQGRRVRIVGTHVDISERKKAEEALQESEERLRLLFESTHDLITMTDEYAAVLWTNPAWENVFSGLEQRANPFILLHPDDRERVTDAWNRLVSQGSEMKHLEYRIQSPQGEYLTFESSVFPLMLGTQRRFYFVTHDITERKLAEKELQRLNQELEQRVEARTRELQEAQEQLLRQEKLAAFGQLAGSVAHELRHPLGVLSNAAYFLNMSLPDANDTTHEYLEMMTTEVRKADKIISDLLDFSRHQASTEKHRESVRPAELIAETLMEQPPPDGIDVVKKIDEEGPPVMVDAQQIKQVLSNLIVNAYQAMPDGGTLSIAVRSDDEQARIEIADTGGGIAPEHLDKLFEPLFSTKSKGIGLGLAIAKTLIEANGGAINIESRVGQGSTFSVTLPVEQQARMP